MNIGAKTQYYGTQDLKFSTQENVSKNVNLESYFEILSYLRNLSRDLNKLNDIQMNKILKDILKFLINFSSQDLLHDRYTAQADLLLPIILELYKIDSDNNLRTEIVTTPYSIRHKLKRSTMFSHKQKQLSIIERFYYSPLDLNDQTYNHEFFLYAISLIHMESLFLNQKVIRIVNYTNNSNHKISKSNTNKLMNILEDQLGVSFLIPPRDYKNPFFSTKIRMMTTKYTHKLYLLWETIAALIVFFHENKCFNPTLLRKLNNLNCSFTPDIHYYQNEVQNNGNIAIKPDTVKLNVILPGKDYLFPCVFDDLFLHFRSYSDVVSQEKMNCLPFDIFLNFVETYKAALIAQTVPSFRCSNCNYTNYCSFCLALDIVSKYSPKGMTGFLVVEYPGYYLNGQNPSKDKIIEHVVRSILKACTHLYPTKVDVNIISYSLGAAICISILQIIHKIFHLAIDFDICNYNLLQLRAILEIKDNEKIEKIFKLDKILLVAPFLSVENFLEDQFNIRSQNSKKILKYFLSKFIPKGSSWNSKRDLETYLDLLEKSHKNSNFTHSDFPTFFFLHGKMDKVNSWYGTESLAQVIIRRYKKFFSKGSNNYKKIFKIYISQATHSNIFSFRAISIAYSYMFL